MYYLIYDRTGFTPFCFSGSDILKDIKVSINNNNNNNTVIIFEMPVINFEQPGEQLLGLTLT